MHKRSRYVVTYILYFIVTTIYYGYFINIMKVFILYTG